MLNHFERHMTPAEDKLVCFWLYHASLWKLLYNWWQIRARKDLRRKLERDLYVRAATSQIRKRA